MNHKFDELTKSMAQSVTRRQALRRFGLGLAGMALACFGLANKTQGQSKPGCQNNTDCAYLAASCVCCDGGYGVKICVPDKSYCPHGKIRY